MGSSFLLLHTPHLAGILTSACMKKIRESSLAKGAIAIAAMLCTTPSFAAPRLYPLAGGFEGGLEVEAGGVHVQNFFYEPDNDDVDVFGYRARPSIVIARGGSDAKLQFGSYVESTNYDLPSPLAHYLDYGASAQFGWVPLTKHRLDFSTEYLHGHDASGLVRSQFGDIDFSRSNKPDEWDEGKFDAGYRFGGPNALAVNSLSFNYREREYANNRNRTDVLDFSTRSIGYQLAYAYTPKTSLVFDLAQTAINYDFRPAGVNRDGDEISALLGLRWVATGKTTGNINAGVRTYSVDSRARPSKQTLTWKLNIDWALTSLTQFNLGAGQKTTETFRANSFFIDARSVDLSWRQKWSQRFSTRSGVGYVRSHFVGLGRKDDNVSAYAGGDFSLFPGIALFGEYSYRNRSSNEALRGFDHAEAKFGVKWNP